MMNWSQLITLTTIGFFIASGITNFIETSPMTRNHGESSTHRYRSWKCVFSSTFLKVEPMRFSRVNQADKDKFWLPSNIAKPISALLLFQETRICKKIHNSLQYRGACRAKGGVVVPLFIYTCYNIHNDIEVSYSLFFGISTTKYRNYFIIHSIPPQ